MSGSEIRLVPAEKRCPRCKETKPSVEFGKNRSRYDGLQSCCRPCMVVLTKKTEPERRKRYYERHKKRIAVERRERPWLDAAHQMVARAIQRGELVRPDACENCGAEARSSDESEPFAHHDDYNHPLQVRWLCGVCHNAWHLDNEAIEPDEWLSPQGRAKQRAVAMLELRRQGLNNQRIADAFDTTTSGVRSTLENKERLARYGLTYIPNPDHRSIKESV